MSQVVCPHADTTQAPLPPGHFPGRGQQWIHPLTMLSSPCPCLCSSHGRSGSSPRPGTHLEQREGRKPQARDEPSVLFWAPPRHCVPTPAPPHPLKAAPDPTIPTKQEKKIQPNGFAMTFSLFDLQLLPLILVPPSRDIPTSWQILCFHSIFYVFMADFTFSRQILCFHGIFHVFTNFLLTFLFSTKPKHSGGTKTCFHRAGQTHK